MISRQPHPTKGLEQNEDLLARWRRHTNRVHEACGCINGSMTRSNPEVYSAAALATLYGVPCQVKTDRGA
jgi:hypothetical protein